MHWVHACQHKPLLASRLRPACRPFTHACVAACRFNSVVRDTEEWDTVSRSDSLARRAVMRPALVSHMPARWYVSTANAHTFLYIGEVSLNQEVASTSAVKVPMSYKILCSTNISRNGSDVVSHQIMSNVCHFKCGSFRDTTYKYWE